MKLYTRLLTRTVLMILGLGAAACSSYKSPTSPMPSPQSASIMVTGAGLSTSSVTVQPGGAVTFTNNDSAPHEIASNPHPTHTQCPELNLGVLQPGGSATVMMANKAETCGFHDHLNPTVTKFQGTIQVMSSGY